jgi:hypothetical protein
MPLFGSIKPRPGKKILRLRARRQSPGLYRLAQGSYIICCNLNEEISAV